MAKPILHIYKKGFIDFYFDNKETIASVLDDLIAQETISLTDYLKDVGFIRSNIIVNPEIVKDEHKSEIDEETGEFEIEFPCENYELKFN